MSRHVDGIAALSHFELEQWDGGKLVVNHAFANLLKRHHWTTFAVVWLQTAEAAVAKNLRTDRITLRFTLDDAGRERTFYIKRHGRSSWKEYVKPLLSLRWPILGAANEWQALLAFHEAGLPTMTPVALGQSGSNSFLITESLEDCTKLSKLVSPDEDSTDHSRGTSDLNGKSGPNSIGRDDSHSGWGRERKGSDGSPLDRRGLVHGVAEMTRRMHGAGLHHQDYYLGHLLLPNAAATGQTPPERIYVIDLGRVRQQRPLSRRWIVKDLAQLNYSAREVSSTDRLRFLRTYLGRRITPADRKLIAGITSKTALIARHSRKNGL